MWGPAFEDCAYTLWVVVGHACPGHCLCLNQRTSTRARRQRPRICVDTSLLHTGPLLSHSHWADSALEIDTTDRDQPIGPSLQLSEPKEQEGLPGVIGDICATWHAQTPKQNTLERRLQVSLLLWKTYQPQSALARNTARRDKDEQATRFGCSARTAKNTVGPRRGGDQIWARRCKNETGDTTSQLPLPLGPQRIWRTLPPPPQYTHTCAHMHTRTHAHTHTRDCRGSDT